jgi:hypothetical protein
MSKRTRATDSDLGDIQKSYVDHLKALLAGEIEDHLSTAAHSGIRSILKDNSITVDPDLTHAVDHRNKIELTLVDQEITPEDIKEA